MISTFIKGNTPNCVNSKIQYRSFKDFDVNKYISDLDNTVYLHDSSECVDDINTMYNDFETKVNFDRSICFLYMAFLSSLFIYGTEFFRGYLYFMGA
jgi:hypothetical protein